MSTEQTEPDVAGTGDEASSEEAVPTDPPAPAKAAAKKAPAKKAAAKRAPAKTAAQKAASKPAIDWLASWKRDAPADDVEQLLEPAEEFLMSQSYLLPSVRKIIEADAELDVRVAALTLFVEADAGSEFRDPARALEGGRR